MKNDSIWLKVLTFWFVVESLTALYFYLNHRPGVMWFFVWLAISCGMITVVELVRFTKQKRKKKL